MAVTSGSPVSSSNVNSAFVSKTATSTQSVVGVVDMNHGSSGGQVSNAQQEINNLKNLSVIVALGKIAFDTCIYFYKKKYCY